MSRRSFAVKSTVISAVAAAALVGITASPALANTVSAGAFACGPDMTVNISWLLSAKATSKLVYDYTLANGDIAQVTLNFAAATSKSVNTGHRAIDAAQISSSKTVEDASYSCVG